MGLCISCKEYVDAATHKYFIQVAKSPEEEQTKKKKKKKKEEDEEEVRSECWPGNVGSKWWSYARRRRRRRRQTPATCLLSHRGHLRHKPSRSKPYCWNRTWWPPRTFQRRRLHHTLSRMVRHADQAWHVTVIAHNFHGYDGYFSVEEYHKQQRQIEQIRNGGKLLQVTHDSIWFRLLVFLSNATGLLSEEPISLNKGKGKR